MSEPAPNAAPAPRPTQPRPRRRMILLHALIALVLCGGAGLWYYQYVPADVGPAQPIPFSHRFHVATKKISCLMCHSTAAYTDRAGVPPMETCMLCHKRIIVTYPWIQQLREHYDKNEPIPWVHVNNRVPGFVFFSHERHLRSGVDCGKCHGDVADMDRVYMKDQFTMGFCVQCHRDNNISHDCLTCHR